MLGRRDGTVVKFAGVLDHGVIRGKRLQVPSGAVSPVVADFIAEPEGAPRAPRLHAFRPEVFYRTFSSSVSPALEIIPGDTVRTWTLDNAGRDSTNTTRSPGGNPLTGPFYVRGALPGDMIAVTLHRVRLNRDDARAGDEIVGNAFTPSHLRRVVEAPDFSSRWRVNRAEGFATLENPTPGLVAYKVPLRPMLGCIGVAPFGAQSIVATESGSFGGNLDYNELVEGVTIYLPVYQRGAFLYIGDGHAAQGAGELTGDALETSMNVEFSVALHRGRAAAGLINGPRAENANFLMAIGISGDLSNALRESTTDLARWLEEEYGLTPPEVAAILGTSAQYDVADVVGSNVSIVAKVPKSVVRQVGRVPERPPSNP